MAGNRSQFYIDYRCLVRFLHWEIVVVACTSPFHFSAFGRFSDSHTESCHRCNAVHLHLVLTFDYARYRVANKKIHAVLHAIAVLTLNVNFKCAQTAARIPNEGDQPNRL